MWDDRADAGVVHQHVDVAEAGEHVRDDAVERRRVGEVGADGVQPPARLALARRLRQAGEAVGVAVHPGDLDAGGQQAERHRPAQPARRPGDDRHLFVGCHWRILLVSLLPRVSPRRPGDARGGSGC